jgi:hypothetical protein
VPEVINSHFTHLLGRRFPSLWLGVKLDAYAPHPIVPTLPVTVPAYDVQWQNGLQLRGVQTETAVGSGHEWWPDLYWAGASNNDVIASWRLFDEAGQLWAQVDRPLWEQFPPTEWPDAGLVYQPHQVNWPAGLPPGQYQVWLRLLDTATRQPIPLSDGQIRSLILPQLTVASAPDVAIAQLPPHTALTADYGAIALIGYQLQNDASYRPGHLLLVDAYWQAQGPLKQDEEWVVQLLDPQGQLAAETITSPSRADYPPTQWQPGELLHGQAILVVPPRAEGGTYTVQMGLRHPANGRFLRQTWFRHSLLTLGTIEVAAWSFETELPAMDTPLQVTFGEPTLAELKGVEVGETAVSANTTLPITLFWHVQGETDSSYLVFIHLIGSDGTIVAQNDAMPVQGSRPTTSWRGGEVLVDAYQLAVGADVAAGEYQLWVGLYDPDTGIRPLTFIDGVPEADGRILLGNITVTDD